MTISYTPLTLDEWSMRLSDEAQFDYDESNYVEHITEHEKRLVRKALDVADNTNTQKESLKVLCFGVGAGREIAAIEDIALERTGTIDLIVQDVSLPALKALEARLKHHGYEHVKGASLKDVGYNAKQDGEKGCLGPTYHKSNPYGADLNVQFVCSHGHDTLRHTSDLIGQYNVLLSLFGVFSVILGPERRLSVAKMLQENMKGAGAISVLSKPLSGQAVMAALDDARAKHVEDMPEALREVNTTYGPVYPDEQSALADLVDLGEWDMINDAYDNGLETVRLFDVDELNAFLSAAGWDVDETCIVNNKLHHDFPRNEKAYLEMHQREYEQVEEANKALVAARTPEERFAICRANCAVGAIVSAKSHPELVYDNSPTL